MHIHRFGRTLLRIIQHRIVLFGIETSGSLRFKHFVLHGGIRTNRQGFFHQPHGFLLMRQYCLFPRHVIQGISLCKGVLSQLELIEGLFIKSISQFMPFAYSTHRCHITERTTFERIFVRMYTSCRNESVHRSHRFACLSILLTLPVVELCCGRSTSHQTNDKHN